MKKTVIALAILASLSAFADLKIGTVNMIHLVELHPTHESNKALVKSSNDDFKAKLDEKQDALKAMLDEAQKKLDGMQQKVNAARQDLIRSEQNYRETMNDLETRLLKMETSDIRAKISVYAKEKGYDLVIDSTMAAYANDDLDVTDDILKAMNVDPAKRKALKDKGKEKKSEGK